MNEPATLESIERAIARGQQAMRLRGPVLRQMLAEGHRKIDLVREVNRIRTEEGVDPVTYDAIQQQIRRAS